MFFARNLFDRTRFYIPEIKKTFSGTIIDKYQTKSFHLKMNTNLGIVDIFNVEDSLWKVSKVGDSLYKIMNENQVVLSSSGKKYRLKYMFVPPEVLQNKNWPKDLKAD